MAATLDAYCRLPEFDAAILALMIWRLQLAGDEVCRVGLSKTLPLVPFDRVVMDPVLRATIDGFWAWLYCTPRAKGITDEQRKIVVERAVQSIKAALDNYPEHGLRALWAAELHAALKSLDDPRAADWEAILAKCPPEEVERAKNALPPYLPPEE